MSDGYTKLFSDIVDSSIWEERPEVCKVWVTLLALCNADGYVRGSDGWLAGKSKVPLAACQEALQKFQSPDSNSRTPDNDGRRIEQLSDGWLILNYLSFRDRLSSNPKAVATRARVQKHRERYQALRNTKSVTPTHPASASASVSPFPTEGGPGETIMKSEPPTNGQLDQRFIRDLLATYRRPAGARLTHLEESSVAEITRRPRYRDEWDMIITLKQKEPRYFPQSLSRLVSNWQETLDRASVWTPSVKTPKTILEKELDAIDRQIRNL